MTPLRILYVGPDYLGSNGTCWRNAFVDLGHKVQTVNNESYTAAPAAFLRRVRRRFLRQPEHTQIQRLNARIIQEVRDFRPELTFYIKTHFVMPETLETSREIGLNFAYMNDDMFADGVATQGFREQIRRCDCILTTKSFSVREYERAGAPLAVYIPNAYDPNIHYPAEPSPEEFLHYAGDIAFIGDFRPLRADLISMLARYQDEFRLNVWGGRWHVLGRLDSLPRSLKWRPLRACIRGTQLWGPDMAKAIRSNKIMLGLLCREVRDLHTSRSFEIPACGGFMLAERTEEHRMYFEEDKEAVYFSTLQELIDKVRFYTAHDGRRNRIARAGYERCMASRARYVDRAADALALYWKLRGGKVMAVGMKGDAVEA